MKEMLSVSKYLVNVKVSHSSTEVFAEILNKWKCCIFKEEICLGHLYEWKHEFFKQIISLRFRKMF